MKLIAVFLIGFYTVRNKKSMPLDNQKHTVL